MLYKFALTYLFFNILVSFVDSQKQEGSVCQWGGQANSIDGVCVPPNRCFTTLDTHSPRHPVCSRKGKSPNLICCTDCELVNDTSNAVIIPTAGVFWKNGQKAHDKCLEYQRDLPYSCNRYSKGGLLRTLDVENECHKYGLWWTAQEESAPESSTAYPYHARLTYHDGSRCNGVIISENYILAIPQCNNYTHANEITQVELGIKDRWDDRRTWQILKTKRLIPHPGYSNTSAYDYIALVETATPIKFNENVLPVCLHVSDTEYEEAETTTWKDPTVDSKDARKLWSFKMRKYSGHVCAEEYSTTDGFDRGFDEETQLCYGDENNINVVCKGKSGEPLVVENELFNCVPKLIGLTSYTSLCGQEGGGINVHSKISHYIPWIESIVWPSE